MPGAHANLCKAILARELSGRRPGTATGHSRRFYQCLHPNNKAQQLDAPEAHICRFSPCGQYLVCLASGFTQLVVYRFTGPRVSWQGDLEEQEIAAMLASFSCFFTLLYRVPLAPAGEVLARDVVLFMHGGSLLLLASHSAITPPPPGPPHETDPLQSLPFAESIHLHLVRLSDGVRAGGSRFECELVDLSGRPGTLGVGVHEDLIVVLALRRQVVHLLQVLRGGEEVVLVRSLGPHVHEDDELVVRMAEEAEERWVRARRAEREAGARTGSSVPLSGPAGAPLEPALPPLRRSINGDLVRGDLQAVLPAAPEGTLVQGALARARAAGAPAAVPAGATTASVYGNTASGPARVGVPAPHGPASAGQQPVLDAQRPAAGLADRPGPSTLAPPLPHPRASSAAPGPGSRPVSGQAGAGIAAAATALDFPTGATGMGPGQPGPAAAGPAAVLYPPAPSHPGHLTAGTEALQPLGAAAPAATAADLEAAAAHQATVRRQVRQQQQNDHVSAQRAAGQPQLQRGFPGGAVPPGAPGDVAAGSEPGPAQLGLRPHPGARSGGGSHLPPHQPAHQQAPLPPHTQQPQHPALEAGLAITLQAHPNPHQHARNHRHHNLAAPRQAQQAPQPSPAPHGLGPRPDAVPLQSPPAVGPPGRVLLDPAGLDGAGGGGSAFVTGIKQRLLAHLYDVLVRQHSNNPRRLQYEIWQQLFLRMDIYRSLVMRKVFLLDRTRILIDMRSPIGADLGTPALGSSGPANTSGMPPIQYFLLFDLQTTHVVSFKAGPGDKLIEKYIRGAIMKEPWAESLPLWDRYTFDSVLAGTRLKLRQRSGPAPAGRAAGPPPDNSPAALSERASCAHKLMQLMPPVGGTCGLSTSPYLDASLYAYDDRVISPYIRTRPCIEQAISFRPRNRADRTGFRWDPGPFEPMVVRDRRLARNVLHLFHPDAPFLLAVFSVFQQTSVNINFRI